VPDGTVCDPTTGNLWEASFPAGLVSWLDAWDRCKFLTTGGIMDWTMPDNTTMDALWTLDDPVVLSAWPWVCNWPAWAGDKCGPLMWSDYGYATYGWNPDLGSMVFNWNYTVEGSQADASFPLDVESSAAARCVRYAE
jgi:hypothetical protein